MKIKSIIKNILIIFLLLIFLFVAVMFVFGFKGYSVVTDSMSPTFKRGYAVFVKKAQFDELKVGDIVTVNFESGEGSFTHRIVEIDKENNRIRTKGDNSNEADGFSDGKNIVGKVAFSIPLAGYISIAVNNKKILTVVLICAALVSVVTTVILIRKNRSGEVTEDEEEQF